MNTIRVLNILESDRAGGPQKRIIAVGKRLKQYNIETIALYPKGATHFTETYQKNGIKTYEANVHRLTKDKIHLFKYIFFLIPEIFSLIRIIKKEKIDIVHCNGSWQFKGIVAAAFTNAESVWHLNDTYMPSFIRNFYKIIASRFSQYFIAASNRTKEYYLEEEWAADKYCQVIQAPIDTSKFSNIDRVNETMESFDGIKILSVGYINPNKGFETYIRMIHEINNQYKGKKPIHFFVAGGVYDSQQAYYEKLKSLAIELNIENLHFLGEINDVPAALNSTDIYICSSDFEASPMSVWEAMCMGKPIVSTDVGDVKEILGDNNAGIVVPTQNASALAKACLYLLDDSSTCEDFSKRAKKVSTEQLDVKICTKLHAEIYQKIMGVENQVPVKKKLIKT